MSGDTHKGETHYQYGNVLNENALTPPGNKIQGTNEPGEQTLLPNMVGPCTAMNLSVLQTVTQTPTTSRVYTIRTGFSPTTTNVITCTVTATSCTSSATATIAANAPVDIEVQTVGSTVDVTSTGDALFGWECQK